MRTLAVETSSARGSVALLDGDDVLAERVFPEGVRHARGLLSCVEALFGAGPREVGLVAVGAGPGSYTGLRVGVMFAKTFAIEMQVPVVGVSSLDVIAANVAEPRALCVVVDARLGQVFAALYNADRQKTKGDIAAPPEDVAAGLARGVCVIGDGLRRHRDIFARAAEVADDESLWWPRAANAGRLGRRQFERAGGADPRALTPRYLGRPQAEVKWEQSRRASGPRSTSTQ